MYNRLTKLLHLLPAEVAHHLSINMLRYFPVKNMIADIDVQDLTQDYWGLKFSHPLGLAAGFDKHAEVFDKLGQLGFSFVEIGSITPRPQPGNPKPRLFRLDEYQAIINRYGFNSKGMEFAAQSLNKYPRTCVMGINLGKNKETQNPIDDFLLGAEKLIDHASYFTINISSPNTPGLRDLQTPEALLPIIEGIQDIIRKKSTATPLLVKVSPDMTESQESALFEFLLDCAVDGIIIANTTTQREGVQASQYAAEAGGLSGPPIRSRSTAMLRRAYQRAQGKIILIGCGGISSGYDAYEKLCAGANLLQIYTAFVYQGPQVIRRILLELKSLLAKAGVNHIREIIGKGM